MWSTPLQGTASERRAASVCGVAEVEPLVRSATTMA